MFVGYVG